MREVRVVGEGAAGEGAAADEADRWHRGAGGGARGGGRGREARGGAGNIAINGDAGEAFLARKGLARGWKQTRDEMGEERAAAGEGGEQLRGEKLREGRGTHVHIQVQVEEVVTWHTCAGHYLPYL